jgi:hypothetical protein
MSYAVGFNVGGIRYSPQGVVAETFPIAAGVLSGDCVTLIGGTFTRGAGTERFGGQVIKAENDSKASIIIDATSWNVPSVATLGAVGTITGLASTATGVVVAVAASASNSWEIIAQATDSSGVVWSHVKRV